MTNLLRRDAAYGHVLDTRGRVATKAEQQTEWFKFQQALTGPSGVPLEKRQLLLHAGNLTVDADGHVSQWPNLLSSVKPNTFGPAVTPRDPDGPYAYMAQPAMFTFPGDVKPPQPAIKIPRTDGATSVQPYKVPLLLDPDEFSIFVIARTNDRSHQYVIGRTTSANLLTGPGLLLRIRAGTSGSPTHYLDYFYDATHAITWEVNLYQSTFAAILTYERGVGRTLWVNGQVRGTDTSTEAKAALTLRDIQLFKGSIADSGQNRFRGLAGLVGMNRVNVLKPAYAPVMSAWIDLIATYPLGA